MYFLTADLAGGSSMGATIIMLIAMVAIFYFMLIRPENKRKKEAEQLRNSLKVGDQITMQFGQRSLTVEVLSIQETVKSADAVTLYREVGR